MTRFSLPSWLRTALLTVLVAGIAPSSALAEAAFGPVVDAFCTPDTPYDDLKAGGVLNECTLCHDSDFGAGVFPAGGNVRTPEKNAWDSSNYAFFCPVANTAPVINPAIGSKMATAGQQLSFAVNAMDADAGDTLTWTAQNAPVGSSLTNGANGMATFSWTPTAGDVGPHSVTFVVTDNAATPASAMEVVSITVSAANQAPALGAIGNQTVNEGQNLSFTVTANDPDVGDVVTLSASNLPSGATFTAATGAFSWTPSFAQSGNFAVTFTAMDDGNPALSDSEAIMITVGDVNRPPVLNPVGNQGVNEGAPLVLNLTSTDPDGDGLTLVASGVPNGGSFVDNADGTGTFSWTPAFGQVGNFNVTFTVTDDGNPPTSDSEMITIAVGDVNRAPSLAPIGNQTVNEGQSLTFNVVATDADGDALTIQGSSLPMGSTLTPSGAGMSVFAWTPAFNQQGNHTVTFTATDNGNPSLNASETLTITVGNVNRPPVLGAINDRTVNEGATLQVALSATDPDGDALTLQLANQPQGLALQDNGDGSGTLAWTPGFGAAGNYNVTVSVTDDGNPVAMDQEAFTITVGDVNRPPTMAPIGNKPVNTNNLLTFMVSGSDPDGDNVSCVATGLPANATFVDNADGTGTFAWTPLDADVGNHMVTFTATDSGNPALQATETITIAVGQVNNPPTLVQIGDRTVLQGQTLSFALLGTDLDGNALSFSAMDVPVGATLTDNMDGTATFSWTPAADQVGSANVTFMVTDDGIPPESDSELVKLAIQGPGGGNFGVTDATWWDTWGGHITVAGVGATPMGSVEILDADTGQMIGMATADAGGDFATGECRSYRKKVKKKKKRRTVTIRECVVPPVAPCEIQVRDGLTLGQRVPVANAPATCGMGGTELLDGMAYFSSSKKKKKRRAATTLSVAGEHAQAMSEVEIRDAVSDAVLQTVMADASGRFSWKDTNPAAVPCFIRLGNLDRFSSEIPVLIRPNKKKGKRGAWRPRCAVPASFPPPAPTATSGSNGVGNGGNLGGGNNGGGNNGGGNNGGGNNGGGNNGGGNNGGGGSTIPAAEQANYDAFLQTVQPLTGAYCVGCHSGAPNAPGNPDIANPMTEDAYHAVWDTQKVNLQQPYASRLVQRITQGHWCWTDCANDAETMRASIAMWSVLVDGGGGGNSQQSITSASQTMADGVEGGGNSRYDDAVIARWEFTEGAGNVAADTSNVAPAMDLTLTGTTWLGGGGIQNVSGKAEASQASSRKLHDLIANPNTGSNEYTIEAWVVPAETDQRGPARIVSYSRDTGSRNFTMGQENYSYAFRNRSRAAGISGNGTPTMVTRADDRDLQTELQHVVMTYDQTEGRRIYVNGAFTDDDDPKGPGSLDNWDPNQWFVIGNEHTNNRLWKGEIRFVAIHNRALTPLEIQSHHLAGVEESFLLRFDVAQWTGQPGSVIELSVSEFDAFSYLFSRPTYVGPTGAGIPIRNLRIMVNGQVPITGQAFRTMDVVASQSPQELSPLASVIGKQMGPADDVFSLAFEVLGDNLAVVVDNDAPVGPGGFVDEGNPDAGLRNFSQINETMAALTGVSPQNRNVERTFEGLTQQLPGDNDLRGFVSAHQVGSFKLAIEYCDRMVESRNAREAIFGTGFNFGATTFQAFQNPNAKALISDSLVEKFYGTALANQPDANQARPVVTQLIDDLTSQCTNAGACDSEHTQSVVKAACTAVLSSAPVLFH